MISMPLCHNGATNASSRTQTDPSVAPDAATTQVFCLLHPPLPLSDAQAAMSQSSSCGA